jgi:hypothetical protein
MQSRYDIMEKGAVLDSEDKDPFPDPLSVNWTEFTLTSSPYLKTLQERYIHRPWLLTYQMYGVSQWDDILLTLNNIPYKEQLRAGDDFFIPSQEDINKFVLETKRKMKSGRVNNGQ